MENLFIQEEIEKISIEEKLQLENITKDYYEKSTKDLLTINDYKLLVKVKNLRIFSFIDSCIERIKNIDFRYLSEIVYTFKINKNGLLRPICDIDLSLSRQPLFKYQHFKELW